MRSEYIDKIVVISSYQQRVGANKKCCGDNSFSRVTTSRSGENVAVTHRKVQQPKRKAKSMEKVTNYLQQATFAFFFSFRTEKLEFLAAFLAAVA